MRWITRVSSRQTAMTSRSLYGAGDVPVMVPGRSRNARRQTDPLGPYTDLDGLQAVSPGLQLLLPHDAYTKTPGSPFFVLLLTFEESMYVSNEVAEIMQMQLSAAEINLVAAEVWVSARKLQEEQKRQRRQERKCLWARSWILRSNASFNIDTGRPSPSSRFWSPSLSFVRYWATRGEKGETRKCILLS